MAWSGSGTINDPYQITTVDELIETTGSLVHYHYKLMNDLDLSSYNPWKTLKNPNFDYGLWIGSLDGNNKIISNLILNQNSIVSSEPPPVPAIYNYIGLFADANSVSASDNPYIKNLVIDNCKLTLHDYSTTYHTDIGTLAARIGNRTIENIKITNYSASIILPYSGSIDIMIGGMYGSSDFSREISCSVLYSTASIFGRIYSGLNTFNFSMFGNVNDSTSSFNYVKDCYIENDILYPDLSQFYVCYVSAMYTSVQGVLNDCYVLDTIISSSDFAAGFARTIYSDTISNVYSSVNFGNTNADNIFPFAYDEFSSFVTYCYYESGSYTFNNIPTMAGLTGSLSSSLKTESTYLNWDFTNVWDISPSFNDGYPYFIKDAPVVVNAIISGSVTSSIGVPIENVTMSFFASGTSNIDYITYTNASGIYSQSLLDTWSGSLIPTYSGYSFYPSNFYFTASATDRTLNYFSIKNFSSGSGVSANPYTILDHEDLYNVRYNMSASVYYQLSSSIDLSSFTNWKPIGTFATPFGGEFDGKRYTISNMRIISASGATDGGRVLTGLFGSVTHSTWGYHIKNFTLYSCSVDIFNNSLKFNGASPTINAGLITGYCRRNHFKEINIISSSIKIIKNSPTSSADAVGTSGASLAGFVGNFSTSDSPYYSYINSCSINYLTITGDISVNYASAQFVLASTVFGWGYASLYKSTINHSYINVTSKYGSYPNITSDNTGCISTGIAQTIWDMKYSYIINTIVSGSVGSRAYGLAETGTGHWSNAYIAVKFGLTNPSLIYPILYSWDWNTNITTGSNIYFETSSVTSSAPSYEPARLTSSFLGLENSQMIMSESYIGWDFNIYYWTQSSVVNDGYPTLKLLTNLFSGSGTEISPYEIWTPTDLDNIRLFPEFSFYKLMDNLDLSSYPSWIPIKTNGEEYYSYLSFDGNNKSISNLTLTTQSAYINGIYYEEYGLFNYVKQYDNENLYIKDLTLLNSKIILDNRDMSADTTGIYAGALCSRFVGPGTLHNINVIGYTCSVQNTTGSNEYWYISGLSSIIQYDVSMSNCNVSNALLIVSGNTLNSGMYVNGISNDVYNDVFVESCSVVDSQIYVDAIEPSSFYINGMFGLFGHGHIKKSVVKGCKITSYTSASYVYMEGFVGDLDAATSDCYVLNVSMSARDRDLGNSDLYVAGFMDYDDGATVLANVYVSADYYNDMNQIYAVVSNTYLPAMTNVYYETKSFTYTEVQSTATALSQSQMQDSSSYVGFDFVNVWEISSSNWNYGYPYLSWEPAYYTVIPPSFIIIYPNGGEVFFYNQMIPISWSFSSGTI